MAALSVRHGQTALGAYYRMMSRRKDGGIAVFATARKLATLVYRLLRLRRAYVDEGAAAVEKRHEHIRLSSLKAKAKELGFHLIPSSAALPSTERVTG